jgi:hypothetical protein
MSLLTACGTTRGTVTSGKSEATSKARCAGWRPISYSAEGKNEPEKHSDTAGTIKQVREHNQTGLNKGCKGFRR